MKKIDAFLNSITSYRLVLIGLTTLATISIVFSLLGLVTFKAPDLIVSLVVIIIASYGSNYLFSKIFKAPTNIESVYITAFILFFLLNPAQNAKDLLPLVLVSVIAMASKYILAVKKRHIFNPVAIAAVLVAAFGSGVVIWWVATPLLTIFVAIIGVLIVRKIRRFRMFLVFLITSILVIAISLSGQVSIPTLIKEVLISWPLLFFATFMLTEPITTPPTKRHQVIYGAIVGVLFSSQFHIGPIFSTPELALVLGNIYSYFVSSKQNIKLLFKSKKQLSATVFDFSFTSTEKIHFKPGQYIEWTLPHEGPDTRGNRRYFTLASSPLENEVHLGVRIDPVRSSSFKKALLNLNEGDSVMAGHLSGEFTLPKDINKKLVFIAGGIGVTPFRSMAQYMVDKNEKRDAVLMYSINTESDIAYKEVFDRAGECGLKTIFVVTKPAGPWEGRTGFITEDMIKSDIPDYKERMFYLSGPNAMVTNYKGMLNKMGITNIKTDYFPGF